MCSHPVYRNENDRTVMREYSKVEAVVEDFVSILQQIHDKDCIHGGVKKTFKRVSKSFLVHCQIVLHFMPHSHKYVQYLYEYLLPRSVVKIYNKLCQICSVRKPQATKPPMKPIVANGLFSRIQVAI